MEIHFVLASCFFEEDRLKSFILKGMKKYQIKKVMVTDFHLARIHLITKEKMEDYCKSKYYGNESVNDDLEKFFEKIRLGKQTNNDAYFYFFPRLSEDEMELLERKDEKFMKTFSMKMNADVAEAEMKASESNSKYVFALGHRTSFTIKNSTKIQFSSCCSLQ